MAVIISKIRKCTRVLQGRTASFYRKAAAVQLTPARRLPLATFCHVLEGKALTHAPLQPSSTVCSIALLSYPLLLPSSPFKDLLMANSCARRRLGGGGVFFAHHFRLISEGLQTQLTARDVGPVTIDVLPDNVLLDIFDFCLDRVQNVVLDRTMQHHCSSGKGWHTSVEDGKTLFLNHHVAWTFTYFAEKEQM